MSTHHLKKTHFFSSNPCCQRCDKPVCKVRRSGYQCQGCDIIFCRDCHKKSDLPICTGVKGSQPKTSTSKLKSGDKKKSAGDDPLAALGIDPSVMALAMGGDDDIVDDGTDLGDMDDADLMAALNTKKKKKKKPPPQASGGDIDVGALLAAVPGEEGDDVDVELTDADMNDPGLLAELGDMASGDEQEPTIPRKTNIEVMSEQLEVAKATYHKLKAEGNLIEAKKKLQEAVNLKNQIKELQTKSSEPSAPAPKNQFVEAPTSVEPRDEPEEMNDQEEDDTADLVARAMALAQAAMAGGVEQEDESVEDATGTSGNAEIQLESVTNLKKQYQQVALAAKRAGDKAMAVEFLRTAKTLDSFLEQLQCGISVDFSKLPAKNPQYPPPAVQKPAPAEPVVSAEERQRIATFTRIEAVWKERIQNLHDIALRAKKEGDRTLALEKYREEKLLRQDLEALRAARNGGCQPPAFREEHLSHTEEFLCSDLGPSEIEICVLCAKQLKLTGHASLEGYVYGDVVLQEGMSSVRLHSSAVSGFDPVFSYRARIPIERKRSLQRVLERKKVSFQLFHRRGMLMKDAEIGKVVFRLNDLLFQCESRQTVPVIRPGSKAQVGSATCDLLLRIRQPLMQNEYRTIEEVLFFVDGPIESPTGVPYNLQAPPPQASPDAPPPEQESGRPRGRSTSGPSSRRGSFSASSAESSGRKLSINAKTSAVPAAGSTSPRTAGSHSVERSAGTTPSPASPRSSVGSTRSSASQESSGAISPISDGPSGALTPAANDIPEDPHSIDNMVSNDVMEWESERVSNQIIQYRVKHQPVPDDLTDRKNLLDTKMQMLIIHVQTGQLTPDAYMERLKTAITSDRNMARKLLRAGRKEDAVLALQRAKIMEKELASSEDDA